MTQATPEKRIRLTERAIQKTKGTKRARQEQKLAYLKTLNKDARFSKGAKIQGEGGWK